MKESVGGISLTMIVITLILLFGGIMSLTISRSNAIAVKDKIVRIIEDADGFNTLVTSLEKPDCDNNSSTLCEIVNTINDYSYRQSGKCPDDSVGFQRDGRVAYSNKEAAFCIIKTKSGRENVDRYYYKVIMFYGIDMPVLRSVLNFKATGETKMLNG
jgi:hypothetical protein